MYHSVRCCSDSHRSERSRSGRGALSATALLLAAGLFLSACGAPRSDVSDRTPDRPVTRVLVDNGNFADVVVYALSGGQYYRLGGATGLHRSTLRLPSHLSGVQDLRLVADPIGAPVAYFSPRILFSPGDVLVLDVGPTMNLSSVTVRSGR